MQKGASSPETHNAAGLQAGGLLRLSQRLSRLRRERAAAAAALRDNEGLLSHSYWISRLATSGAALAGVLRRCASWSASLRPCPDIHARSFVRFDEISYLIEKSSDLTLPDFVSCRGVAALYCFALGPGFRLEIPVRGHHVLFHFFSFLCRHHKHH